MNFKSVTDRQTDRWTDGQKAMHMNPPCNMHRWAQKSAKTLECQRKKSPYANFFLVSNNFSSSEDSSSIEYTEDGLSMRHELTRGPGTEVGSHMSIYLKSHVVGKRMLLAFR